MIDLNTDLIARLKMDQIGPGNSVDDELGNYTGTAHGTIQVVDGVFDSALEFSDDGDYIVLPRIPHSQAFGVSFWAKLNDLAKIDGQWLINSRSDTIGNTQEWQVQLRGGNPGELGANIFTDAPDVQFDCNTGFFPQFDKPANIIFTFGNGKIRIYFEKVLLKEASYSGSVNTGSSNTIIGTRGFSIGAGGARGYIDNIRFYSRFLTQDWADELYKEGIKQIGIDIQENLACDEWNVDMISVVDDILSRREIVSAGQHSFDISYPFPALNITVSPRLDGVWTPEKAIAAGDKKIPTDPIAAPYYYEALSAGTTSSSEPVWPTGAGEQVVDNDITWQLVERLTQPITHGPLIPS